MISDSQRRFNCRMLFLLICVAPTSVVGYWICHPPTAAQWEREIQAQLGLATSIDSIENPGPQVTILRGLKFTDPELGALFEAMEVRLEFGQTNQVVIDQTVRLTSAGLLQLVHTLNEHAIRAHSADRPWHISFRDHLIVQESIHSDALGSSFPQTLLVDKLEIVVDPLTNGTQTKLRFQLPESESLRQSVECVLSRSHASPNQPSLQRYELKTNNLKLPCWLLGDLVPEIKVLGPRCQFAGRVDVNPEHGHPKGWFKGQFTQIENNELMGRTELVPDSSYQAEVRICQLDGGVDQLDGDLIWPDGTRAPIQNTMHVIDQFDVVEAIRTAAETDSKVRQQADLGYR